MKFTMREIVDDLLAVALGAAWNYVSHGGPARMRPQRGVYRLEFRFAVLHVGRNAGLRHPTLWVLPAAKTLLAVEVMSIAIARPAEFGVVVTAVVAVIPSLHVFQVLRRSAVQREQLPGVLIDDLADGWLPLDIKAEDSPVLHWGKS